MSLRRQAADDLRLIVEDVAAFGWSIVVTNPAGEAFDVVGLSGDVGLTIDPETGVAVIGRRAHVALTFASLASVGTPIGMASTVGKPWRVTFPDIGGTSREFKVVETAPDQTLGLLVCLLESYRP